MFLKRLSIAAPVLVLAVTPAAAHPGHFGATSFTAGLAHPLSGLDHILAMVAVGLFAARLGGRAMWLVPSAFVAMMIAGGTLGYAGVSLPAVEQGIAVSVIAMGLAVAFNMRLPTAAAMGLVGLFALFHGHAHGTEGIGLGASFMPYAAGFVAATALLHCAGIALGLGLDRLGRARGDMLRRAAGIAGALAGVVLLAA